MEYVTSRDGTRIAYDRVGSGPALILVAGALGVRGEPMTAGLAEALASHFTVIDYDRRGRGDSDDTPPYAIAHEVEDIEALIDAVGGSAALYGMSSGAVLALEAASRLPGKVNRLAMYEPPFITDDSRPPVPDDYAEQVQAVLAQGKRDKAVEMFMAAVGVPDEFVAMMRQDPSWAEMEKVAHTLPYDFTLVQGLQSGRTLPPERVKQWAAASMPALAIVGGESEPFFHSAADLLVGILPNARRATLEGQNHAVSGEALAPMLAAFFAGNPQPLSR